MKLTGFSLSMLSPVWRAKICGEVGCASKGQLELESGEMHAIKKVVELCCGVSVAVDGVTEMLTLGHAADRYQVEAVQGTVEDALVNEHLTVQNCGAILAASVCSGLDKAAIKSRELALRK